VNRVFQFLAMFFLAAILTTSFGCTKVPDDAKISSAIQGKFSQDSGLAAKQLAVQSSNGVVTLAGSVDNEAQWEAAARQASAVEGVRDVVNNLQVGSTLRASAPAPAKQNNSGARPANKPAASGKPSPARAVKDAPLVGDRGEDEPTSAEDSQPPPTKPQETPLAAAPLAGAQPPTPAEPQPQKVTIEQGTPISVRLIDSIDSEKNQSGDTFHATLNTPLSAEGAEAIPAGTDITGHLVDVESASKFSGKPLVVLQLDSIKANGKSYDLQTDQYRKEGSSRGKNTAEKVGGGAILGGIIGAIAGGGKGAAIGSAAGAGVGAGTQAAGKGQKIKLPSETVLNFTLQAPVTVIRSPGANADRQKLGDP
jgi:hypothetical protein